MREAYEKAFDAYLFFSPYLPRQREPVGPGTSYSLELCPHPYEAIRLADSSIRSIADMKEAVRAWFSPEIAHRLLKNDIVDGLPLYVEENGQLYRFAGYVGQFTPHLGEASFSIAESTEEKIRYRMHLEAEDMAGRVVLDYDYIYEKSADGRWRFTAFQLPIDLYIAAACTP